MKKLIFQYLILLFSITAYLILVIELHTIEIKRFRADSSIFENATEGNSEINQMNANQISEFDLYSNELILIQEISNNFFIEPNYIKYSDSTIDAATIFYSIIMMYPPVNGDENMIVKRNQKINSGEKHKNLDVGFSISYEN